MVLLLANRYTSLVASFIDVNLTSIFRMNRNNQDIPLVIRQKEMNLLMFGVDNARKSGIGSDGTSNR